MTVAIAVAPPSRKTLYPATERLSVEAVHERLITVALAAVAVKPVGTDGGVVSGAPASVVADAEADFADWLPAASKADTV